MTISYSPTVTYQRPVFSLLDGAEDRTDIGPVTRQAVAGLERIERMIEHIETETGPTAVLGALNGIDPELAFSHIEIYRNFIRSNEWPHHPMPTDDNAVFVQKFLGAASFYATTALTIAAWREGKNGFTLAEIHHKAIVSETLRGQFGKSAPDGLDVRIDRLADALLEILTEDELDLAGMLPAPLQSAEASMVSEFLTVRELTPTVPSIDELLADTPGGPLWKFARRHAKGRLDLLETLFEDLDGIERHTHTSGVATEHRAELIASLSPKAVGLVDELTAFNFLNLALEPTISFKSGLGLLHSSVYSIAEQYGPTPGLRQLALDARAIPLDIPAVGLADIFTNGDN